ncbi:MAG: FtsK/SpoIIIE domain-containing protein, partial [Actinomycetota bacterium]|nr:FtsK/SpoIIIE domain-containing protein [Actinomycetota bacterium]
MRIEFSVVGPNGCRDVAIVADPVTPFDGLLRELAVLVGAAPQDSAWCGSRVVPAHVGWADCGLYTGAILSFLPPERGPVLVGVRSLALVGGAQAGQVVALGPGRLTIGRAPGCDLVLDDDRVSRTHAILEVGRSTLLLRDLGSTNGTTVDGESVSAAGVEIKTNEIVRIGDSLLSVAGTETTPAAVTSSAGRLLVNRAPRRHESATSEPVDAPTPPDAELPRRVQWITALLPAVGGVALASMMHASQFLLFALLSPLMLLSGALGDRVHWRRSRRRDAAEFRRARAVADAEISSALTAETVRRRGAAPDPPTVLRIARAPGVRLWERSRGDADSLHVRVGSGDLPSVLQVRTAAATTAAGTVVSVPVRLDLHAGALGIAGPIESVVGLARWLVIQLAVLHSPRDLELVFLLDPRTASRWDWARWLPHTHGAAIEPDDQVTTVTRLSAMVSARRRRGRRESSPWDGPWTVLVIDRASPLSGLNGVPELLLDGPAVGVSAVCLDPAACGLPAACTSLVNSGQPSSSRVSVRTRVGPLQTEFTDVVGDRVSAAFAEQVARSLAPLVDAGTGHGALPPDCALGDVIALDLGAVMARWRASDGGAHTVLGLAADGPLTVDLARDGPHALIAGTTGSGKSELLRTLVIGLAATHPPDELTFLLVDYKGGAAFGACGALPHTAGLVTDLDQHLTRRALTSLHAELRRRERIFADAVVADLSAYRATGSTPTIARLVIVVDEFAALADELPDFVTGLIGVAQRGRSLGVHLVLATQRPGSAVSPEIRANTSLRIALRMTDAAESSDVIDVPDAALLDSAQPGRAFLRAGSSPVAFQTAEVNSAAASGEPGIEILDHWRRRPARPRQSGHEGTTRVIAVLAEGAART